MVISFNRASITAVCRLIACLCLFFLLPDASGRAAETPTPLRGVIQQAILNNPEVQEKWYDLQASTEEQERSRGGYLPKIDFSSRIGKEWRETSVSETEFQPAEASLQLAQMLYDGFATRNEVRKFGHVRLAKFYELLDTSENIALETVRAYLDVLKYRHLLQLAETNYQQHRTVYQQVRERVEAGVGRGVDLEQATGRLALADSNRITELTNLHDVSSRYLRIVGSLPPVLMEEPGKLFSDQLPDQIDNALKLAFQSHPAFLAAVENVQAASAERDAQKAANQPKLEFRARHDRGYDRSSIDGQSEESVVELVLNYNLFNGGSDSAAIRQFTNKTRQARRQQARVCRTVRQTLDIAFNDTQRLADQLVQLDRHQKSIANARVAYRNQFDIGQRTLLDLLDTENEYFQARRSYVISSYDQQLAQARTLAGFGQLLSRLDIRQDGLPQLTDFSPGQTVIDPDSICPPVAAPQPVLTREQEAAFKTLELKPSVLTSRPARPIAVPPKVAAQPAVKKTAVKIEKKLKVNFPYKETRMPAAEAPQLAELVEFLKQHPQAVVTVTGHTDNVGSDKYNQQLSRARAESVRDRLVDDFGVEAGRVYVSWFGFSKPKGYNVTPEGRSENRRVELQVALLEEQQEPLAVLFPYRETEVPAEHQEQLAVVAEALQKNPQAVVTLSGHTDKTGGRNYNQKLAQARVASVRSQLVDRYGILPGRIYQAWSSYQQTYGDSGTLSAAESRRTDLQVTQIKTDLSALDSPAPPVEKIW